MTKNHSYLIPIQGLRVVSPWVVGAARLHTDESLLDLLDAQDPDIREHRVAGPVVRERLAAMDGSTLAEVRASDIDEALELCRAATDVLRVFQLARLGLTKMTTFGLQGDVYLSRIEFLQLSDTPGLGFRDRGESVGVTFNEAARAEFEASTAFQFASAAAATLQPQDEGSRRALMGVQLLAQAALDHRANVKILHLVVALETLLLQARSGSQALVLARRIAYFDCGRPWNDLCGRGRDTCALLALNPFDDLDRKRLSTLRQKAKTDPRWGCSSWFRALDWYESRSQFVHGEQAVTSAKDGSDAEFHVLRWLIEPILDWLHLHRDDPIGALETELLTLGPDPDWHTLAMGKGFDS